MATDFNVIRHFFMRYYKEWDISHLLDQDIRGEEKFADCLFNTELKKIDGKTISYREKFNLLKEMKKQELFEELAAVEEQHDYSENSDHNEGFDGQQFDQDDEFDIEDNYENEMTQSTSSASSLSPVRSTTLNRSVQVTFIRSASSLKYPIYFVLNLKPREMNLTSYSTGALQRCLNNNRFDVSKFEFRFLAKQEPQLLLKNKDFSTVATTITGCIAQPLLHIFPYLVPYDIVVQVSTKFVLEYPEWNAKFDQFVKEYPKKTDLDLINWLAVKIKSRFTTRAKNILIPLGLYPDTIESLDETDLEEIPLDKLIKKKKERKIEPQGKTTTSIVAVENDSKEKSKQKKAPICPQYFDYREAILFLHQHHKEFRAEQLVSKNLKSKTNSHKDAALAEIERISTILQPVPKEKQTFSAKSTSSFATSSTGSISSAQSRSTSVREIYSVSASSTSARINSRSKASFASDKSSSVKGNSSKSGSSSVSSYSGDITSAQSGSSSGSNEISAGSISCTTKFTDNSSTLSDVIASKSACQSPIIQTSTKQKNNKAQSKRMQQSIIEAPIESETLEDAVLTLPSKPMSTSTENISKPLYDSLTSKSIADNESASIQTKQQTRKSKTRPKLSQKQPSIINPVNPSEVLYENTVIPKIVAQNLGAEQAAISNIMAMVEQSLVNNKIKFPLAEGKYVFGTSGINPPLAATSTSKSTESSKSVVKRKNVMSQKNNQSPINESGRILEDDVNDDEKLQAPAKKTKSQTRSRNRKN